jgi:hypothetical protein
MEDKKSIKKERTCIVKDQDCHKYRIPLKMKTKFLKDCEEAYDMDSKGDCSKIDDFEDEFGKYRFG